MENFSSSQDYICSTSQEITYLLENQKSDYCYRRQYIKMWIQNPQNWYTNKVMCVLCWRFKCTEGPSSLPLIMTLMKTIKSPTILLSNTAFYIILLSLPRGPSYSGFLSKHCIPVLFMYACYAPHMHYPPSANYVNNNWCTISHEAHYWIFYIPLFLHYPHQRKIVTYSLRDSLEGFEYGTKVGWKKSVIHPSTKVLAPASTFYEIRSLRKNLLAGHCTLFSVGVLNEHKGCRKRFNMIIVNGTILCLPFLYSIPFYSILLYSMCI